MTSPLDGLALTATAAAIVAAGIALVRTRSLRVALPVLLDLLLAAGLLGLAVLPTWSRIATAAAIVLLRHLIGGGLRASG